MPRKHKENSSVFDSTGAPPPPVRAPRRAAARDNSLTEERWQALKNQLDLALERRQSPRQEPRTFHQLAQSWLASYGKRLVEPRNEERHVGHLKPLWAFGERELTPRRVRDVLSSLARPRGRLSPSTVNKVRATGKQVIREAQLNREWGPYNPFEQVKRLKQRPKKGLALTLEDCRRVLRVLRSDRRREALVHMTLGLRPGELKALRKVDVDTHARALLIRRSNQRNATKTGTERRIPVPDAVWHVITQAVEDSPCEWVFPTPEGTQQRADTKLSRTLREALIEADVVQGYRYTCRRKGCGYGAEIAERVSATCPTCDFKLHRRGIPKPARWYDLRGTCATLLRKAGCDALVIKHVLGHSPRGVTESHYIHHQDDDYVRAELAKLALP